MKTGRTNFGNTTLAESLPVLCLPRRRWNMTSDGTHSYTWDARNRLSQIDSGNTASFSYDPFGRRTSKAVLSTQTGFLYDSANPVQELSGSSVTANLLSGGVDEVFQRTDSAGARSFLTDALGSTLALTDSTGVAQTSYTFEAFGNTTSSGASSTNSFVYTGRELDASGLNFNRSRYYHPTLQRFVSEDPTGLGGGINTYAYVSNSPTNFFDPLGLNKKDPFDRAKDALRCAASLSQAGSLNNLTGKDIPVVGANFFGDLAGGLLGPEPGTDPTTGSLDRIDQGLSAAKDIVLHQAVEHAPQIVVGVSVFNGIGQPVSYVSGVYNPITLGETSVSVTLGENAVAGGLLSGLATALNWKMVYDAGVFVGAFAVCELQ
jgi:RHS repeat-associated protein